MNQLDVLRRGSGIREVQQTRATCPHYLADEIGLSMWTRHMTVETACLCPVCFEDSTELPCDVGR